MNLCYKFKKVQKQSDLIGFWLTVLGKWLALHDMELVLQLQKWVILGTAQVSLTLMPEQETATFKDKEMSDAT